MQSTLSFPLKVFSQSIAITSLIALSFYYTQNIGLQYNWYHRPGPIAIEGVLQVPSMFIPQLAIQ